MGNASNKEKLRFAVDALASTEVPQEDTDFWDALWRLKTSADDVFEMVGPDDVRTLRRKSPGNLRTLFDQAVCQLCQVIQTPLPQYFDQALNCVRVLTRLLPFILEDPNDEWVTRLCWSTDDGPAAPASEAKADGGRASDPRTEGGEGEEDELREPLGQLMVHATMHLLFLPSFTVDTHAFDQQYDDSAAEEDVYEVVHAGALWSGGLVAPDDQIVRSVTFDKNRVEVLRLMLAMLCEPLFRPADQFDGRSSLWLRTATSTNVPFASLLFASLLNSIVSFDPVGWGVPYGANVSRVGHPARLLEKSVQVLIVLLDFKPEPAAAAAAAASQEGGAEAGPPSSAPHPNVYLELLSQLGQDSPKADFDPIFNGLARLLNNVHESANVYLPGSVMTIECHQELLVLLWKLLEENPLFMPYVLKNCDVSQLVVPICYFMFEARQDPSKMGLVHMCAFILLKLSGERNFCVQLNRPYTRTLPMDLPLFSGTHTDLLVIVLHKLVVNGSDKLAPLYNCFLTIICNVSPYCKSLSLVSAVKLVNLFELFTSPRFLYAAEGNHVYVALLLEVFNNVVQYQYGGNPHLVYAILRRKNIFEGLSTLTLPRAVQAAEEQRRRREAKGGAGPASAAAPPSNMFATTETNRAPPDADTTDLPTDDGATAPAAPAAPADDAAASAPVPQNGATSEAKASAGSDGGGNGDVGVEREGGAGTTLEAPAPATPGPQTPERWVPSSEWLKSVQSELPLTTIMRLLQNLVPQVMELANRRETAIDETQIMAFITNTTMVGLLPVPHPIVIRKYTPNHFTSLWFTAFMWGVIFLENQFMPLYDGSTIKLFTVTVAAPPPS